MRSFYRLKSIGTKNEVKRLLTVAAAVSCREKVNNSTLELGKKFLKSEKNRASSSKEDRKVISKRKGFTLNSNLGSWTLYTCQNRNEKEENSVFKVTELQMSDNHQIDRAGLGSYLGSYLEIKKEAISKQDKARLRPGKDKCLKNDRNDCNTRSKINAKASLSLPAQSNYSLPTPLRAHVKLQRMVAELRRILLLRCGDVERLPGPRNTGDQNSGTARPSVRPNLFVLSYNVRGLGDEKKLRHLMNYCYQQQGGPNEEFLCFMQETYIVNETKIPYLWRGNYHVTPGNGHSCGCVTLLSHNLNVIETRELGERGHIIVCQKIGDRRATYIVANLYAPNCNNLEKIEFFENLFENLNELSLNHDCVNIIVAGDFNLVFNKSETKNRLYNAQEARVATSVKNFISQANLTSIWKSKAEFTWNRANSDCFSTIDHVLFCSDHLQIKQVRTNWALSCSDHAAVEVGFEPIGQKETNRTRITRLDPTLLKDGVIKAKISDEIRNLLEAAPEGWDPHLKLDFAKMCIRTAMEKEQADRKLRERTEEEYVNLELDIAIRTLQSNSLSNEAHAELLELVEELRGKKRLLIDEKGERLAEKLGTKWYHEGEKSTKYFLGLMKRSNPDKFKIIEDSNGGEIVEDKEIKEEIVKFYKMLYEDYDKSNLEQDEEFFNNIQTISEAEDTEVTKPITIEELKKTLDTCKDSSPGPDGIPYGVLKELWPIVGDLIVNAWNHSLVTKNLCPSHQQSFLKLIPKEGKDLKKLTNWRPITLSNCDHKIITKTYSNRISERLAFKIKERQTAYLKGRMINDNIRAILGSISASNMDDSIDGLLVSLDAKKAFDSVEHSYIEKCLEKFGLKKFVPIFRILYNDLRSDIIINGEVVKGYKIKRGVKQGDALSCILFIMCMEPLLLNIESNAEIEPIDSVKLGCVLPKIYAYADDVNGVIKNKAESLKAVFKEYARLTKVSGLELNAEKTELMKLRKRRGLEAERPLVFEINYMNKEYRIATCAEVKINGIVMQQDEEAGKEANVDRAVQRMTKIFKTWSRRRLTTLGKILLVKTFGISQCIFLMQSFSFDQSHLKAVNHQLYKFIWNRHYLAAKAPERIKREIVNKPIKLGGLGMLDIEELDISLKLRAYGRLKDSRHPFLVMIREKLSDQYFFPKCKMNLDTVTNAGLKILERDREAMLRCEALNGNCKVLATIREIRLVHLVKPKTKNSIVMFNLRTRGCEKVGQLSDGDLNMILPLLINKDLTKLRACRAQGIGAQKLDAWETYYDNKIINMAKASSKEIRSSRSIKDPICIYKLGAIMTPLEVSNWGYNIKRLSCVRHKNTLLRAAHGEIYSRNKLLRYGLSNDDICPRCHESEDLRHKLIECPYVARIWKRVFELTNVQENHVERENQILGAYKECNVTKLTVHAEVLARILSLKDKETYIIHPKIFVRHAILYLTKKERKNEIKTELEALLR